MKKIIIAAALAATALAITLGLSAEAVSESIKYARVRW